MFQNSSTVECVRQTDLAFALYVHQIKIRWSTVSPMYSGRIEYEFRNVNVPLSSSIAHTTNCDEF